MKLNKRPSLLFIQAINFELTYQCNIQCDHCLQQEIRKTCSGKWISTSSVQKALTDIRSIGFTPIGVNFTGGEIFLPGSNLPELLETAQSLKIDVRVNTNGWWGNQVNIGVGSLRFPSASHVVGWLRDLDVSILALSFDQRYEKNSALLDSVISAIKVCEQQGQHYHSFKE